MCTIATCSKCMKNSAENIHVHVMLYSRLKQETRKVVNEPSSSKIFVNNTQIQAKSMEQ